MTSKAQRWYEAQQAVEHRYAVSSGIWAAIILISNDGPRLELVVEPVSVMPTAAEALALARWIISEFGEEEES